MLKNFDWVSFVLNFIAGTFFGGMFGLCWWRYAPFGYFIPLPPLKWILACALIFGVVIGYLGDRFWDALFHIHQS